MKSSRLMLAVAAAAAAGAAMQGGAEVLPREFDSAVSPGPYSSPYKSRPRSGLGGGKRYSTFAKKKAKAKMAAKSKRKNRR